MAQKKVYDNEFKIQAVKFTREIGFSKAAKELGIHTDTLYGWNKHAKDAWLDLGPGTQTPDSAMSLNEEVHKLRQQNKEQPKEINRLKEELLYGRYDTKKMTIEELKTLIWRYFIVYWNTRRICSANGGLPPMIKRKQYYDALEQAV